MTGIPDIQVHTVFSATQQLPGHRQPRLRILGLLTFLIALAWLYGTWVPMYKWVQQSLVMGELHILARLSNENADQAEHGDLNTLKNIMHPPPRAKETPEEETARLQREEKAKIAQHTLAATAVCWLAITSLVGLWLAISGSAAVMSGNIARTVGFVLTPASIAFAAGIFLYVRREYHWYETVLPHWVIPTMVACGVMFAAGLGAGLNRHARWLCRSSGVLIILASVCSMAAIWIAIRWGQMPANQVTYVSYIQIFAIQSAYGWLMLLATMGIK